MRSLRHLTVALTLLTPLALRAQGGQVVMQNGVVVTGNSTAWTPSINPTDGFAQVTHDKPCGLAASGACSGGYGGVGAGSLKLSLQGVPMFDNAGKIIGYPGWAFYTQTSSAVGGYGSLSKLSELSFDWYRTGLQGWNDAPGTISNSNGQAINPVDWRYKTPVVRLALRETRGSVVTFTELVSAPTSPADAITTSQRLISGIARRACRTTTSGM
jgi:hypothetical protein